MQVWCVPIMGKAVKVRTVELPFVAMAWVHATPQVRGPPAHREQLGTACPHVALPHNRAHPQTATPPLPRHTREYESVSVPTDCDRCVSVSPLLATPARGRAPPDAARPQEARGG